VSENNEPIVTDPGHRCFKSLHRDTAFQLTISQIEQETLEPHEKSVNYQRNLSQRAQLLGHNHEATTRDEIPLRLALTLSRNEPPRLPPFCSLFQPYYY
jgi:hypothetical protein